MIVLFTDFGDASPYPGQMRLALAATAPGVPVVDLTHAAPRFRPKAAAYLLAALSSEIPAGAVTVAVVDPGVGTARSPVVVHADGRWYVGPNNGLFEMICRRAAEVAAWTITWRPERLSATFHGRDLFAPVAAAIARGEPVPGVAREPESLRRPNWPEDLAEIVFIDPFGNAMTGMRAAAISAGAWLVAGGARIARADTFASVRPGDAMWFENANGLAEIAVNQGSAADRFRLQLGDSVAVVSPR